IIVPGLRVASDSPGFADAAGELIADGCARAQKSPVSIRTATAIEMNAIGAMRCIAPNLRAVRSEMRSEKCSRSFIHRSVDLIHKKRLPELFTRRTVLYISMRR